jgi:hypothetical protein
LLTFSCCAFGYIDERFQYFVEPAMGLNLVALIELLRFSTFSIFFLKNSAKSGTNIICAKPENVL